MGRDVYFGVNLQSVDLGHHKRGGTDDVTAIRMLSADVDIGSDGHKDSNRPATVSEALDIISALPEPSIIVVSGNGLHPHWILSEPWIIHNVRQHKDAQEFVAGWINTIARAADEYGGYLVDATKDLARVLRVPGTLNFKGEPKPVTILRTTDASYTFSDLKPYLSKPKSTTNGTPEADGDRIERAAQAIAPYVGNGQNHNLSLHLFGFLRGQNGDRLSSEDTRRLVSRAWELGGFPPNPDHGALMQGLETTNANIEAGKPVTGGVKLNDIAPDLARELGSILWPESRIRPTKGIAEEPPGIDVLADRLLEDAGGDLCFSMGEWKRYQDGVWSPIDGVLVEKRAVDIGRAAAAEGVKYSWWVASQIYNTVKRDLAVSSDLWDKSPNLLVCKNGTLDLETMTLRDHSREDYITAGVPHPYDPSATGETWDRITSYVAEYLGEDVLAFLQEYYGYILTANTDAEIMLYFYGPRGSGRSTFIEAAEIMLGPALFLSRSLSGLQDRFGRADLIGKRLIVSKEASQLKLLETDLIDAIISGESIPVEKKGRDMITYAPVAKIIQAANKLPRVPNTEAGIYRRLKVVEFPALQVPKDTSLKRKLREEGPYILQWALEGLRRLLDRGDFDIPESIEMASQNWHSENNVVGLFIESCVASGDDKDNYNFHQSAVHQLYVKWCQQHRLGALSLPEFTKATWNKEAFYIEHQGMSRGYKILKGVKLTPEGHTANTLGRGSFLDYIIDLDAC
jgi:P4 family phage/plasmid primase-like protien